MRTLLQIKAEIKGLEKQRYNYTKDNGGEIGFPFRRKMNSFSSKIRKLETLAKERGA